MSDEWKPMPGEIWARMMSGTISPREAAAEAAEVAPTRDAFNQTIRSRIANQADARLEQRERLRGRLFGAPSEPPRDEAGRFAAQQTSGFDGGARGPLPAPRGRREKVSDAIGTLVEEHGRQGAEHGPGN